MKHLPKDIAQALNEAKTCFDNKCYAAAILMLRATIIQIGYDLGCRSSTPFEPSVALIRNSGYIAPKQLPALELIEELCDERRGHGVSAFRRDYAIIAMNVVEAFLRFKYEMEGTIAEIAA